MKSFASILPVVGFCAAVNAAAYSNGTEYTTITTDIYTTYCPAPTEVVLGTKTYTVTEATTLTITDCPCTVTKPIHHTPKPSVSTGVPAYPVVTVTTTVDSFTTYCPYPTNIVISPNSTITVSSATTLTVTACPCTLTQTGVESTIIKTLTTYCPSPTTLIYGTTTIPVFAPGTVTVPVTIKTIVPVPSGPAPPASTAPGVPGTNAPSSPPATTSGPIQVSTNAGSSNKVGIMGMAGALGAVMLI